MDRINLVVVGLKVGLRQYELAWLIGVPYSAICGLEQGRIAITLEITDRIRRAIDEAQTAKSK